MSSDLLIAKDVAVSYRGGGIGVSGVSLSAPVGEVVGLLGPNGAGKSSTLSALAGYLRRDVAYLHSGTIEFKGVDITRTGPVERARLGIAMVPEREKIFADLTAAENLKIARGLVDAKTFANQQDLALEVFPDLQRHLHRKGGLLSGGQRQMLAIASAICANPSLILVDELTLGLAPALVQSMCASLKRLAEEGLTVVMAEQNVAIGLSLSQMIHVLDGGSVVASGTPDALRDQEQIMTTYLGGH